MMDEDQVTEQARESVQQEDFNPAPFKEAEKIASEIINAPVIIPPLKLEIVAPNE
jgi:hypothetical protein